MSEQPKAPTASGWYDDPHDEAQLRYWDGILWTQRTMPKLRPGLEHVGEARPTPPVETGSGAQPYVPRGSASPQPQWTGDQPHGGGQGFGASDPRMQPFGNTVGQPSGIWRRIVAFFLDRMLVGVPVVLAMMPFLGSWVNDLRAFSDRFTAAAANNEQLPTLPDSLLTPPLAMSVALILVGFVYETALTARFGATLGKRALGVRVVPLEAEPLSTERLGWGRSLVRAAVKALPDTLALVTALAAFGGLLRFAILLWALTNVLRRGLDDVAARSVVRRTR